MLAKAYCDVGEGNPPPYEHLRGWEDLVCLIPRHTWYTAGLYLNYVPCPEDRGGGLLCGFLSEVPRADSDTGRTVLNYFDGQTRGRGCLLRQELLSRDGVAFVVTFLLWGLRRPASLTPVTPATYMDQLQGYTYEKHCAMVEHIDAFAKALLRLTSKRFTAVHSTAWEMCIKPPGLRRWKPRRDLDQYPTMPSPANDAHPHVKIARLKA